jgi:thiamine-monophosphate kinase
MIEPSTPLSEVGERRFLEHLERRIPRGLGVIVGVGDDAAALDGLGPTALITVDSLVEGVHFRREWFPPRLLGRKALSVNLSDIAAMGGTPRHATISLCLPPDTPFGFVDGLYDGLLERAAETGVSLVGGNVAAIGAAIVIDVTLLGQGDRVITRGGAQAGDKILVTGTLGAPAAGLLLLGQGVRVDEEGTLTSTGVFTESSAKPLAHCLARHLDPQPPIAFGRSLAEAAVARAAIDVSDGLSSDLTRLCEASGLQATIDAALVPVDEDAKVVARAAGKDALDLALHGGDEYQLLLAVDPERVAEAHELALVWHVKLTEIGEFREGPAEAWIRRNGVPHALRAAGHEHFRVAEPPVVPAPR